MESLSTKNLLLTYRDTKNLLTKDLLLENIKKIIVKNTNKIISYYLILKPPTQDILEQEEGNEYAILLILENRVRTRNCRYFDFQIENHTFNGKYQNILKIDNWDIKNNSLNVKKTLTQIQCLLIYLLKKDKNPYIQGFNLDLLKKLHFISKNFLESKVDYEFEEFQPHYREDSNLSLIKFKLLTINLNEKFEFLEKNTICICHYKDKASFLSLIITNEAFVVGKSFSEKNIKIAIDMTDNIEITENIEKKMYIENKMNLFFFHPERTTSSFEIFQMLNNCPKIYIFYTASEEQTNLYKTIIQNFLKLCNWSTIDLIELREITKQSVNLNKNNRDISENSRPLVKELTFS
jgi:hypothetical protein